MAFHSLTTIKSCGGTPPDSSWASATGGQPLLVLCDKFNGQALFFIGLKNLNIHSNLYADGVKVRKSHKYKMYSNGPLRSQRFRKIAPSED